MVKILFIIHFVLYNTIMPTKKYLILGLDDNDDNDDNEDEDDKQIWHKLYLKLHKCKLYLHITSI